MFVDIATARRIEAAGSGDLATFVRAAPPSP
jgi:hypothetical protein